MKPAMLFFSAVLLLWGIANADPSQWEINFNSNLLLSVNTWGLDAEFLALAVLRIPIADLGWDRGFGHVVCVPGRQRRLPGHTKPTIANPTRCAGPGSQYNQK